MTDKIVQPGSGTLEDEREVTRVLIRYCELLDTGQVARIADEIFAEKAVADYNFDVLNGRSAINDYLVLNMGRYKETAHILSNVSLKACDGQFAEVTAMITALHWMGETADSASASFGQIIVTSDRLEREAGAWRSVHHRARALGSSFALSAGSAVLRRD